MKKRMFLLILLCFILCGCSAEVNIELTKYSVTEDTILYIDESDPEILSDYKLIFRENMPIYYDVTLAEEDPDQAVSGIRYYDFKKTEQNYGYDLNYKHQFNLEDYNNSRLLRNSFKSAYVEKDNKEDIIEFYTDNEGIKMMKNYPQLTSVKVNIKTDLLVLETNADSVNGNVYTWNFNKDNYPRNIYIKASTTQKSTASTKKEEPEEKPGTEEPGDEPEEKPVNPGNKGNNGSVNGTISRSTEVDPEEEEKNKKAWIFIPLCIIGLVVLVFVVNTASKLKNK